MNLQFAYYLRVAELAQSKSIAAIVRPSNLRWPTGESSED
jgi:hypothetical protein